MDVAGPLVADVLALPEVLHELTTREHALGLGDEQGEELELGRRHVPRLAVDHHDVSVRVELQAAGADRLR